MRKIILAILMLIFFLLALLQNLRPCPGLSNPDAPTPVKRKVMPVQGEGQVQQSKKINSTAADSCAAIFCGR